MSAATPTLHFAQAALAAGQRIRGWRAPAALLTFLADSLAEAGDHPRAWRLARQALDEQARVTGQLLEQAGAIADLVAIAAGPPSKDDGAERTAQAPSPKPEAVAAADGLTPRERDLLSLLARGYSNKDIAASLALSGDTVKWHLKNLFAKLGAHSRRHAVLRARTLGLLDDREAPVRERAGAD